MAGNALPRTVQEAVDWYVSYYSSKDIDGLISLCSPDFMGYGSGPDEVVLSAAEFITAATRDFSQCDTIRMELIHPHIREGIRAAWLLSECIMTAESGGNAIRMNGRMTAVFRQTPGGWQVAMIHFAMPYSGQEPGHSFPVSGSE